MQCQLVIENSCTNHKEQSRLTKFVKFGYLSTIGKFCNNFWSIYKQISDLTQTLTPNTTCIERRRFLSNNPVKIADYKKYVNKLNQLKLFSKKVLYRKQFNLLRSDFKATTKFIGTFN